jgi:hypothetical protein
MMAETSLDLVDVVHLGTRRDVGSPPAAQRQHYRQTVLMHLRRCLIERHFELSGAAQPNGFGALLLGPPLWWKV